MNPPLALPTAPVASTYPERDSPHDAELSNLRWQDMFADPRLQTLIALSLNGNRDLRIAALQAQEARAQLRIAGAARLPASDIEASYVRSRVPLSVAGAGVGIDPGDAPNGGVEFGQFGAQALLTSFEIDLFGRLRSQSQAALERYLASDEGRRSAMITVIGTVADAYLSERLAKELLELTEATLTDWQVSLDLTRKLEAAGQVGGTEVAVAEGMVRQAEADREQRVRELAQARNALVLAVGAPIPARLPDGIPLMQQPIETHLAAGLPSDLLLRRPDIRQAEHELRAANFDVGAARASLFPRISLTGAFGFASLGLQNLFSDANQNWSFSPQFTLPLFQPQSGGAVEAVEVRREIAVAHYERAIQTAFREVSDNLAGRETFYRQRSAQAQVAEAALVRSHKTELRFRHGVESRLELLEAQRGQYAASQALLEIRRAELSNAVSMYRALGGGTTASD